MKRNLAYLLVSALLLFSLTACGCTATPQDEGAGSSTQEENTQTGDTQNNGGQSGGQNSDSAVIGGDSGNGGNASGDTQNPIEEGMNDIQNGVNDAVDDMTGNHNSAGNSANDGGVPFDEMLENGKVKE